MVKTVNRQPYSVNQLNYGDIKYKYFTHNEWKGVCDDKNYLSIDQFTFADSNNVYVDAEGILKSRPSVKPRRTGGQSKAQDCFTFGNFVVYQHLLSNKTYLSIFEIQADGTEKQLALNGLNATNDLLLVADKFKLIVANQKLYIFEVNRIAEVSLTPSPYSSDTPFYSCSLSLPYVPITEYFVGSSRTELESKNELTKSYISRYLYDKNDSAIKLNTSALAGKSITVRRQDGTWIGSLRDFRPIAELTIVDDVNIGITIGSKNGHRFFFGNDTGIVLAGDANYNMYYSVNGHSFVGLPVLLGAIGLPALSKSTDHVFAVLFKADGPYAYTLAGGAQTANGRIPYTTWTKLADFGEVTFDANFAQGDFLDETIFAVRNSNTSVYTYEKEKLTQHIDNHTTSGMISICCTQGYTSVIRNSKQTIYYNDSDVSAPGFTITNKPDTALDDLNTFKQQYANRMLTLAYMSGTDYTDGAIEFKSIYLSEDDIANHITSIPDIQKLEKTVKFGTHLDGPIGNIQDYHIALSSTLKVVTMDYFIVSDSVVLNARMGYVPLTFAGDNFYAKEGNDVVTSNLSRPVYLDILHQGDNTIIVFDHEAELSEYFISKGKNLYVSARGSNLKQDEFKWYFPEMNTQTFDYDITNLHLISTTETAVFLKDSIYYVTKSTATINGIEQTVYSYYKSRIPLGCEEGSDVITSYDNKYTMFVTKRGFVAMAYQDFISSQEQALTFLSDEIFDLFNEWNDGPIKLFQYNFWIILYKPLSAKSFVFDMRSNSWWPIEYNNKGKKLIEINRQPLLLGMNNYLYYFDKGNDNYFDGNSLEDGRINWHITSQKLHLDAINYYKHIVNLTLFGYNYGSEDALMKFNLRVINYRKQTDTNETKSFESVEYKIQLTRTFVKRINYYKVNQMQYVIESCRDVDEYDEHPIPLSLTCISVKYLVTGQVR